MAERPSGGALPRRESSLGSVGQRIPLPPTLIEEFLKSTALFKACDPVVATNSAPYFEAHAFSSGAMLLRAGTPGESMALLYRGRASLMNVNAATGASVAIETLQPGDIFGEVGPLLGSAHPHTVVADEACTILKLPLTVMETLCARVPAFSHALARRLATRVVQIGVLGLRSSGGSPGPGRGSHAPVMPPQLEGGIQLLAAADGASGGPQATIPYVECADYDLNQKVLSLIPVRLIQQHRLLPLQLRGKTLTVGMVNPRNVAALSELRRVLHTLDFEVAAISMDDYAGTLVRLKLHTGAAKDMPGKQIGADTLSFDVADSEREAEKNVRVIGDEVVRLVNKIVAAGLEREASDIHIEPDATGVKVRFRVHGVLDDWSEFIPASLARGLVARFKVLAGLDITERRFPQDGRIGLAVGRREIDLRLSTVPAARGEKVVLRVCDAASTMRQLDLTFVEPNTLAVVRRALNLPAGSIVIAGGTGSGKTSSLYSILNERRRARPDSNILMVEDPIEYRLPGITQIQTNATIGLGFPQVLRAMLRQDPDVIAVGETRDADTAHLALEAAMTGHLMLTSLHASDAFSVLQRIESLGCTRSLMAHGLSVIIVQRLVPKLCGNCCRLDTPPPALIEGLVARKLIDRAANVALPRPVGCDVCGSTGTQGRVAVIETLQIDDELRAGLMANHSLADLEKTATQHRLYQPYRWYASYLMSRRMISAADAMMAVTV